MNKIFLLIKSIFFKIRQNKIVNKIIKYSFIESIIAGLISGIIVTYGMTEYYEAQKVRELEKFKEIAFSDIGQTLKKHIETYQNMYKASSLSLDPNDSNIDIFFDKFLNTVAALDLEKNAPVLYPNAYTGTYENEKWIKYLIKEINEFRNEMKYKINQYKGYLSAEEIKMFQNVETNVFDSFIGMLANDYTVQQKQGNKLCIYAEGEIFTEAMNVALNHFKTIIKYYEKHPYTKNIELFDNKRLFYERIAPTLGDSRLKYLEK